MRLKIARTAIVGIGEWPNPPTSSLLRLGMRAQDGCFGIGVSITQTLGRLYPNFGREIRIIAMKMMASLAESVSSIVIWNAFSRYFAPPPSRHLLQARRWNPDPMTIEIGTSRRRRAVMKLASRLTRIDNEGGESQMKAPAQSWSPRYFG